jgi:hypothetical protein
MSDHNFGRAEQALQPATITETTRALSIQAQAQAQAQAGTRDFGTTPWYFSTDNAVQWCTEIAFASVIESCPPPNPIKSICDGVESKQHEPTRIVATRNAALD